MMFNAYTQDGQRNRSINSSVQGQELANVANILGRTANQNVDLSNRANQQAAEITNRQQAVDAERLTKLYEQGIISQQSYDNATRQGRENILKTRAMADDNRQKLNLLNQTTPDYQIDPSTGRMYFKSKEAQDNYFAGPADNGTSEIDKYIDYFMKKGLSPSDAVDAYAKILHGSSNTKTTYPNDPRKNKTTQKT